jgi:uncharacterized protein YegL
MPKTHIAIVLDMSGSMSATVEATKSGVKEYIKTTRKDIPDARFSLTVFDNIIEKWVVDARLGDIRAGGIIENYKPRNMTALYDAIGKTIDDLKGKVKKKDKAIVVVMTDGYENASKFYTQSFIRSLITELQNNGNWTFVFLGANIDSWGVSQNLGFYHNNTVDYNYGKGQLAAFRGTATASAGLARSRSVSTQDFYGDSGVKVEEFTQNNINATNALDTSKLWTPDNKKDENVIKSS